MVVRWLHFSLSSRFLFLPRSNKYSLHTHLNILSVHCAYRAYTHTLIYCPYTVLKGDQYWNWANRPPEVAGFSLKKNIAIKKKFKIVQKVAIWRFNIGEFTVRSQKKFIFYFHVIHHFLGNLMLNSNQKSVLKKIENWVS